MPKSSDGLRKLGPGRWEARFTARDPATGKKSLDTTRVIHANTRAEALIERVRLQREIVGSKGEWTVAEAVEAWLPSMPTNTRNARTSQSRGFRERFGERRLSSVQPAEVQAWIAGLPVADETANQYRAAIMALYAYARNQGKLIGQNPMGQTVKRRTPKTSAELLAELEQPRPRRALIGNEVARFFAELEALDRDLVPLVRTQLLLGCRFGEVSALQWRDVDWDTGFVAIRRNQLRLGELGPPKGKRARDAVLGTEGLALLRGHRAAMERAAWPGWDVWVFPRPPNPLDRRRHDMWTYDTVRRRVREALTNAGVSLANVTHAMRHTHITVARQLEQDALLRSTVGHSDARHTERYTDESHRAAVAVRFAAEFEEKLAGVSSGGVPKIGRAKSHKKDA